MADISGYVSNIRQAESGETVRDSIINCLNAINNDQPIKTEPLDVTENGTYSSNGKAYSPVTVHVSGGSSGYKFKELVVTENGTYEPEDGEMFNKVEVDIDPERDIMKDPLNITQNGEYDALLDGYYGYQKIIVNVNEISGAGPFEVKFYKDSNKTQLADTQIVQKYGNAIYSGPAIQAPIGSIFSGWTPDPLNVTRDLECVPNFTSKIVDINQITDSWATICQNGGEPYALGSYCAMPVEHFQWRLADMLQILPKWGNHPNISQYPDAIMEWDVTFIMYKVATGEQGTKSTWLSRPTISPLRMVGDQSTEYKLSGAGGTTDWGGYPTYNDSTVDRFLELIFYQSMPAVFKQHIVPVNKFYQYINRNNSQHTHYPYNCVSINRHLWIPSIKELMTTGEISASTMESNLYVPNSSGNFDTNKEIFYDCVPSAVSYFRDILGISKEDYLTAMTASGLSYALRDSYISDTGQTGWMWPVMDGSGKIVSTNNRYYGYHRDGVLMFGFCLS